MFTTAALLGLGGISVLAATTTVWFLRAMRVAIPDSRLVFLLGWTFGGFLGAASFVSAGAGWLSGLFGALSVVGSLFFLGLYALRKQKAGGSISVGNVVPAFEAPDDSGGTYKSEALIGTPTLMKFFRGHW
jgi:hypothetical protein